MVYKTWGYQEFSKLSQHNGKLPLPWWKLGNYPVISIYGANVWVTVWKKPTVQKSRLKFSMKKYPKLLVCYHSLYLFCKSRRGGRLRGRKSIIRTRQSWLDTPKTILVICTRYLIHKPGGPPWVDILSGKSGKYWSGRNHEDVPLFE